MDLSFSKFMFFIPGYGQNYKFCNVRSGIANSAQRVKKELLPEELKVVPVKETPQQRLKRLTQFDVYQCPYCRKGRMHVVEILPKIRSPGNVLYPAKNRTIAQ